MPSPLHPRSRQTSSLFATTLLVSFLVVTMPHLLPCPAPRVEFADEDGRKRRRKVAMTAETPSATGTSIVADANAQTPRAAVPQVTTSTQSTTLISDRLKARIESEENDNEVRKASEADWPEGLSEGEMLRKRSHECPVPKPRGWESWVEVWRGGWRQQRGARGDSNDEDGKG
ncbi:hypothetical protein MMC25_007917 [Agyrium rufum]|nr:hypothetical protein [Agyrium rufum]